MSSHPDQRPEPALALVELASLARGAVVIDAIVKRSPVRIARAERVSPGKYLIVIRGGVAEVDEGFDAALKAARDLLVDSLFLPQPHTHILDALDDRYAGVVVDSLGLFESYTAATATGALDRALKATDIDLCGLHLCAGIGGKGYWVVSGPLHLVQEAVAVGREGIAPERITTTEVIARPHGEAITAFLAPFRSGTTT